MTATDTKALMFLGFLVGLLLALVLFLGDQVEPDPGPWTPQTVGTPITTEVDGG